MKNWRIMFWLAVFSFVSCGAAFGAGFHIHEQGAMGMANAFVAQADDPSGPVLQSGRHCFSGGDPEQSGRNRHLGAGDGV